jgi:glycosyltransferase involved in cell wall biosynthesis
LNRHSDALTTDAGLPSLLVFSDDWGRHPSSCQHLIGQLLPKYRVDWVNTIGTRPPRLNWSTAVRGFEKIKQWTRKSAPAETTSWPENLHLHSPKMWPWFRSGFDRKLNRRLLTKALLPILESLPQPPIAITTLPIVADLIGTLPVQKWVYYCVDDFSQWPGLDGETLDRLEREMVPKVDVSLAVSKTLEKRLAQLGKSAHPLTHGVDVDFWQSRPKTPVPEIADLPRPIITFWGLIDQRLDMGFVRQLATDLEGGTILFVGPDNDPDPSLFQLPRIHRLSALPFERLPDLAVESEVLIMPYADLPVTQAMQPLKLKEYLATGKPVVVRDLLANREWADSLDLASNADEFSRLVRERLKTGVPAEQLVSRQRLSEETWQAKARQFEHFFQNGSITLNAAPRS